MAPSTPEEEFLADKPISALRNYSKYDWLFAVFQLYIESCDWKSLHFIYPGSEIIRQEQILDEKYKGIGKESKSLANFRAWNQLAGIPTKDFQVGEPEQESLDDALLSPKTAKSFTKYMELLPRALESYSYSEAKSPIPVAIWIEESTRAIEQALQKPDCEETLNDLLELPCWDWPLDSPLDLWPQGQFSLDCYYYANLFATWLQHEPVFFSQLATNSHLDVNRGARTAEMENSEQITPSFVKDLQKASGQNKPPTMLDAFIWNVAAADFKQALYQGCSAINPFPSNLSKHDQAVLLAGTEEINKRHRQDVLNNLDQDTVRQLAGIKDEALRNLDALLKINNALESCNQGGTVAEFLEVQSLGYKLTSPVERAYLPVPYLESYYTTALDNGLPKIVALETTSMLIGHRWRRACICFYFLEHFGEFEEVFQRHTSNSLPVYRYATLPYPELLNGGYYKVLLGIYERTHGNLPELPTDEAEKEFIIQERDRAYKGEVAWASKEFQTHPKWKYHRGLVEEWVLKTLDRLELFSNTETRLSLSEIIPEELTSRVVPTGKRITPPKDSCLKVLWINIVRQPPEWLQTLSQATTATLPIPQAANSSHPLNPDSQVQTKLNLTPLNLEVLIFMMDSPGQHLTIKAFNDKFWQSASEDETENVRQAINKIKNALVAIGFKRDVINTQKGRQNKALGYGLLLTDEEITLLKEAVKSCEILSNSAS